MGLVEYKWTGPIQATRPLEFGTCPNNNLCSQGHREHKMNVSIGPYFLEDDLTTQNFRSKNNTPADYNRNNLCSSMNAFFIIEIIAFTKVRK